MRYGASTFRFLAACGLTAAALLACGVTTHAQTTGGRSGGSTTGGSTGMGSGGFGGGGGSGGGSSLGSSNGFGNSGNGQFSFSGGQSFVGSSSQQSFTGGSGSSGSFTGSSNGGTFSGTSGSGGANSLGGGGFRGGSTSVGVSSMNPFHATYANPLAAGLGTGTSNAAFGQALFSNLSPTSTNLLGSTSSGLGGAARIGGGGLGGGGLGGGGSQATGGNFRALGVVNRNSVVVSLPTGFLPAGPAAVAPAVGPAVPLGTLPARMQTDLQGLISRADLSPATRSAVTLGLDGGGNVVIRGGAASAADARAIESLFRFAPGVRGVRNEMTWK